MAARQQAHIGHADERKASPTIRAHAPIRTRQADPRSCFPRRHIAGETAFANNVRTLRRHAFVIESKGAESWPMFRAGIADDVDNFRTVLEPPELIEREEAHAGVIRFATKDAVQLNRMADRFMDLQAKL